MYICGKCGIQTKPGVKLNKVVIRARPKEYLPRPLENNPGGSGYETVEETKVCSDCAEKLSKKE